MARGDDNPFELYGIDPRAGPQAITQRLRELVEDAPEAEREALRAAWDELTMNPLRRLKAALFAHPETRAPLDGAPRRRRLPPGGSVASLELRGLVVLPELTPLALGERKGLGAHPGEAAPVFPSFDEDPGLEEK